MVNVNKLSKDKNSSLPITKVLKNAPLPQKRALQNGFASHRFRFTWFSRCEKKSQLKRRYSRKTPLRPRNTVTAAKNPLPTKHRTEDKESHYVRLRIKILNKYLLAGESE
jgi:hypothetical protein